MHNTANMNYTNVEIINVLLKRGANIRYLNDHILIDGILYSRPRMFAFLSQNSIDMCAHDDYVWRMSIDHGHLRMISVLLEYGADVHADDDYAWYESVRQGNLEIVSLLLTHGVNVCANNNYALRISIVLNRLKIVEKLLEHGADIYFDDAVTLKNLQTVCGFNEGVANLILPYCECKDYHYFPVTYIERKVIPMKSAANV